MVQCLEDRVNNKGQAFVDSFILDLIMFSTTLDEASMNIVALVNLKGVIADSSGGGGPMSNSGGLSFQKVRHLLEQAFAIPQVLGVVLVINSPGGSPTQTNLIGSFIRVKAEAAKIPVYAVVEDIAASGGYWLACAADEIYVDANSTVGSIGVISQQVGLTNLMEKAGIEAKVLTSVKNKAGMNPFMDIDKKQREIVMENMQVVHDNFEEWVKERRPQLKDADSEVFSGRVFIGEEATRKGLADGVATLTEMLDKKFPNAKDLKLIEVKLKSEGGLSGLLGPFFGSSVRIFHQLSDMLERVQGPNSSLPIV